MAKWMVTAKKADFEGISKKYKIDPVIARIMRNRDICTDYEIDQYLNGKLEDLHNPFLMKDMDKGTAFIANSIRQQEKIRIMGDYDIDGVCSTYILEEGLSFCGAFVDCVIPHRTKDGYGINERLIEEAKNDGIKAIITCDNGISAYEQILLANSMGIHVVITDHHEIPYEDTSEGRIYKTPMAEAVIDPKQEDCTYPYKGICGGVVAYKFIEALCITMEKDKEQTSLLMKKLLEIAAFATVGDVMELRDENRIIVKYGLKYMEHTQNIGLKALMDATMIAGKKITPFHVGFVLGPCMNATGRLDTAARALHLLSSKNSKEAAQIAGDLKALNDSRKEMTLKGVEQAIEIISKKGMEKD
ncbi:MAG: single-stranded-DNA-specific exonuclease RecJ, partial [Clostridiales bacterium]|nr:single-stranded-DNA-specific exonuclease RecJ [Clostridiales bacterium]